MVSHEDEPTPIRYYQLFNNGIGIIIWTKLINVTGVDDVIWNGRYDQGGYRILIGQSQIVDLATTGIAPNQPFYLSSDTLWGLERVDRRHAFVYEPTSNQMATAIRTGPSRAGELLWTGTTSY